ncbi:MAG: hypothetical protein IPJ11_13865 [Gemmatimonadetes bacterium]|nr:hypothetical protein [Gemmatimonadota bacterium]
MKLWLLPSLLLVTACGRASESATATTSLEPTTSDSAGVTVLRHEGDPFGRAPKLTLDSVAIAEIKGSADDAAADISTIAPTLFLADGRLVGRDQQRQVIVLFGADGTSRKEFGRPGAGPGEFGAIGNIVAGGGDSLLVQDYANARLTVVDPASGLGAEYPLAKAMADGGNVLIGAAHGRLLLYGLNITSGADVAAGTPSGIKGVLFNPVADVSRRAFTTGAAEKPAEAPRVVEGTGGMMMVGMPIRMKTFEAFPTAFAWGGRFVVADPNHFRMEFRDTTGTLQQVLVVAQARQAVTEKLLNDNASEMIAQFTGASSGRASTMSVGSTRAIGGGGAGPDTAEMRKNMLANEHADSLPLFDRTQVSPNGTLWVVDYPMPGTDGWAATAFAKDGRILGRIVEVTGTAPLAFGDDRVVFRTEDELGIGTFTIRRVHFPK